MRFFLIDKVTELVVGERIRGLKAITLTDEVLHDHFPDYPILPGVLIIEAAAQLAGFLIEATVNDDEGPIRRALLAQIDRVKLYEPAGPGEVLELEARIIARLDSAVRISCEVSSGPRRVARVGQLTFILKAIDSERVHEQRRSLYRLWTRDLSHPPPIR